MEKKRKLPKWLAIILLILFGYIFIMGLMGLISKILVLHQWGLDSYDGFFSNIGELVGIMIFPILSGFGIRYMWKSIKEK